MVGGPWSPLEGTKAPERGRDSSAFPASQLSSSHFSSTLKSRASFQNANLTPLPLLSGNGLQHKVPTIEPGI